MNGPVVLGDMKINRPWPESGGESSERFVKDIGIPVEVFGHDAVGGVGIVAESVEERVGHVCLEPDGLGAVSEFEQLDHFAPAMHAAPADFAFSGEPFSKTLGRR